MIVKNLFRHVLKYLENLSKERLRKELKAIYSERKIFICDRRIRNGKFRKRGKMSDNQPENLLGDFIFHPHFFAERINVYEEDDTYILAFMLGCYLYTKDDPSKEMYDFCIEQLGRWDRLILKKYLKEKLLNQKYKLIEWCREKNDENGWVVITGLMVDK